jgi:hypothetical protein
MGDLRYGHCDCNRRFYHAFAFVKMCSGEQHPNSRRRRGRMASFCRRSSGWRPSCSCIKRRLGKVSCPAQGRNGVTSLVFCLGQGKQRVRLRIFGAGGST